MAILTVKSFISSVNTYKGGVEIQDTPENISRDFDFLTANSYKIYMIRPNSQTPLTISAQQFYQDRLTYNSSILNKIQGIYDPVRRVNYYTLAIKGSSNEIASDIDALALAANQSFSQIVSISLTDKNPLKITAIQLNKDINALNKITNGYSLIIEDTSYNIGNNISQIKNNISKLAGITFHNIHIKDTSNNISNNIDLLESNVSKITKIIRTDKAPLAINVTQLTNDSKILSVIDGGYTLAITDKSANINIDNLLTNSKIVSIALTDKPALAIALSGSGASIKNNGAANTLVGSKLNDTLTGGVGKDTLTGGAGSDTFVFKALLDSKTNVDTITDFVSRTDKIQLPLTVFTKVGVAGALKVDDLKLSTQALDATDRIIYNASTGALSYDADGNGPTAAVQFAIVGVSTHPTLVNTDFVIA